VSQPRRDGLEGNHTALSAAASCIAGIQAPEIADLRDSGALEQDADVVMILRQDKESGERRRTGRREAEPQQTAWFDRAAPRPPALPSCRQRGAAGAADDRRHVDPVRRLRGEDHD